MIAVFSVFALGISVVLFLAGLYSVLVQELPTRSRVRRAIEGASDGVVGLLGGGQGAAPQASPALIPSLTGLAELAKAMKGLTGGIQLLLLSVVFFLYAVALVVGQAATGK